ncbi:hypothetical protein [Yoonia sp. SS1-5]|uniref:Uncharacterized protein n=1 Tax=Yoonia rhodophyticola TaxID=3137370 RepID=A0AAN0NJE4_9RHOB
MDIPFEELLLRRGDNYAFQLEVGERGMVGTIPFCQKDGVLMMSRFEKVSDPDLQDDGLPTNAFMVTRLAGDRFSADFFPKPGNASDPNVSDPIERTVALRSYIIRYSFPSCEFMSSAAPTKDSEIFFRVAELNGFSSLKELFGEE